MATSDKLNTLIKEYNQKADENNVSIALMKLHFNFANFTFDAKEKYTKEYVQKLVNEYKSKVIDINLETEKEMKALAGKMAAIKYPNLSNSDTGLKNIGESQLSQAQNLLFTNPNPTKLISAIQDALNMKRYDFAFNIIDHIMSYSNNPTSRLGQRQVIEAVQNAYNSFEKKDELNSVAKELRNDQLIIKSSLDILAQLESGKKFIMSADLFWALSQGMTVEERKRALGDPPEGGNLTDYIRASKGDPETVTGISYNA
jgi:hypothetical protein